jgi:UDP-N-acetylglucosamine 2-epimerase (non-hydrolysing)
MWVPVAHLEAGNRSGDWGMPEEINRIVTDSITNHFFTTTEAAGATLRETGVADDRIHFVGNTMIDSLLANRNRFRAPDFWERAGLVAGDYLVATLHRPSNVDDPEKLKALLHAISAGARGRSVVFPVHPRTAKALAAIGPLPNGILPVEPQPYLEFNYLVAHALGVITDSGGVTEETTVLGIPCMTLRTTTERPETVTMGTNELLGVDPAAIQPALSRLLDGRWKKGTVPPLWDGHAAERIVATLERLHPAL